MHLLGICTEPLLPNRERRRSLPQRAVPPREPRGDADWPAGPAACGELAAALAEFSREEIVCIIAISRLPGV